MYKIPFTRRGVQKHRDSFDQGSTLVVVYSRTGVVPTFVQGGTVLPKMSFLNVLTMPQVSKNATTGNHFDTNRRGSQIILLLALKRLESNGILTLFMVQKRALI